MIVISEHSNNVLSRIRLGTTSRKAEELWTARCDDGTLRYAADGKLILLDNFGKSEEILCHRDDILTSQNYLNQKLVDSSNNCFPSLLLLYSFASGLKNNSNSFFEVPDLCLLRDCMGMMTDVIL